MSNVEATPKTISEYHEFYLQRLYALINAYGSLGASDVHILPDDGIYTVTDGVLMRDQSPHAIVGHAEIAEWLRQPGQLGQATEEVLEQFGHVTLAFDTGRYRTRGSFRRTSHGVSATFRIIPRVVPDADAVGVPQVVQELAKKSAGLILIAGPTGSGKTTAIAALVNQLNMNSDRHFYLIEDPIEFVHAPFGNSVFTQREIGVHAADFSSAIENALRSKPNVIVVGELLNVAASRAALQAATTGHLVISTAHAGSVAEAIENFIGQFATGEQSLIRSRLSQSLLAILVQKLVPAVGGGLVAAREVMINSRNFQELIRDPTKINMVNQQLQSSAGCTTLEDSLLSLVRTGRITPSVATEQAMNTEAVVDGLLRMEKNR
ncbi:MAG: Flp pilus assembly complex ATPase component TadA [Microbacteriaceae bacterium]|nr:Flp pilus assembly complex ATPase component TadA [Microbacteriaceae bacterium]